LAGANLIYGLGMLESGVTMDFGQLVMDNEFARMIKHTVAGISVNDDTLLLDDIHAVGAFGDFLSLDSTLRHMREQSRTECIDRRVRVDWRAAGSSSMPERATAAALRILDAPLPEPLTPEVAAGLRAIVTETEQELGLA
jgi:trimethylamine---corrinoid protein Co-methyltransferase